MRIIGGRGEVALPFRRADVDIPEGVEIPPGCVPVKLPSTFKLLSARQIAECVELVEPPPEFGIEKLPRDGTWKQKHDI